MVSPGAAEKITTARPFVIRDPVHGYLAVAAHERLVIDHPITQRLRRIAQTGMADLVFPEARTSRFFHSLGAMNLASRFLVACIENADVEVRDSFFKEIEAAHNLSICTLEELDQLLERDGAIAPLSSARATFRNVDTKTQAKYRRLLVLVESGLRFAALFHDLGHLPFSHDGEYALQDFVKKKKNASDHVSEGLVRMTSGALPPHEEIGHRLAGLAIATSVPRNQGHTRAAFEMGKRILDMQPPDYEAQLSPKASALAWLHSLVDGEIDVDRADYLLRDGQALGLDFASYDIDRLVNNLVLASHSELGYITAVRESGLPALESFCLSRSRSTEVFVHHHKVAQTNVALRYASVYVYDRTEEGKVLLKFLEGFSRVTPSDDREEIERLLQRFSEFDDGWWIQALRALRRDPPKDPLLKPCLEFILDRSRTLSSVWKRRGDLTSESLAMINESVGAFSTTQKGIDLASVRETLRKKEILILPFKFRPFVRRPDPVSGLPSSGKSLMMVKTNSRGLEPACQVSSRISSLQQAWDSELHLYACTVQETNLETARETVLAEIRPKNEPSSTAT
ncbi:MAG TPA: hypothetical protein VHU44_04335 [Acidobacteriaceae bacterium]|nr:hypothetical protein [Acidobacteriaceae bacterium]